MITTTKMRARIHASTHHVQPSSRWINARANRGSIGDYAPGVACGKLSVLDQPFSRRHDSGRIIVWLNRPHCVGRQPPCSSLHGGSNSLTAIQEVLLRARHGPHAHPDAFHHDQWFAGGTCPATTICWWSQNTTQRPTMDEHGLQQCLSAALCLKQAHCLVSIIRPLYAGGR